MSRNCEDCWLILAQDCVNRAETVSPRLGYSEFVEEDGEEGLLEKASDIRRTSYRTFLVLLGPREACVEPAWLCQGTVQVSRATKPINDFLVRQVTKKVKTMATRIIG